MIKILHKNPAQLDFVFFLFDVRMRNRTLLVLF